MEGVFTSNLNTVKKYVDIETNLEEKEAFKQMHGLGESLVKKAFEQGMEQGGLVQLINLVQLGHLSLEIAAETAGMSIEEFESTMKELGR